MENIQEHLKKIEKDQLLHGIDSLDDTVRNEVGRHFAVSQLIQPALVHGYYSTAQNRYILGPGSWRDNMVPNSSWTTTSQAALTLTCPAGHRYRVYYAAGRNATQATDAVLSGNIGGNAWTDFNDKGGGAITQQDTIVLIGGQGRVNDGVAVVGHDSLKELWLNAGDTLTFTLTTYAAANNTEHLFMFEDYTL